MVKRLYTPPRLNATSLDTALSGFSNGSTFLIMAGFMMSQGVNSTTLGKRFANYSVIQFGGSIQGVLLGVLLAPHISTLFGFLLIVQTLPSVDTYTTGLYTPLDLFRAGLWLTLASMIIMIITALVW